MRRALRDNSLSLVFGGLFLLVLVGQAVSGLAFVNDELRSGQLPTLSFWAYVTSAEFAVDVTENWQSEFLQFALYVFGTVWLVQRGSPESKAVDEVGGGTDEQAKVGEHAQPDSPRWARARGWRHSVYGSSLVLTMLGLFLLSWTAQAVAGWSAYNEDGLRDHQEPVPWASYLATGEFWNRSLQNWQSELLAIGAFAVIAVFLRQRGSPESKPVGEPHESTAVTN